MARGSSAERWSVGSASDSQLVGADAGGWWVVRDVGGCGAVRFPNRRRSGRPLPRTSSAWAWRRSSSTSHSRTWASMPSHWTDSGTASALPTTSRETRSTSSAADHWRRWPVDSTPRVRSQGRERTVAGGGDAISLRLEDVAYTLQVGREPMEHRLAVAAVSPQNSCSGSARSPRTAERRSTCFAARSTTRGGIGGTGDDRRSADRRRGRRRSLAGELPRLAEMWVAGALDRLESTVHGRDAAIESRCRRIHLRELATGLPQSGHAVVSPSRGHSIPSSIGSWRMRAWREGLAFRNHSPPMT